MDIKPDRGRNTEQKQKMAQSYTNTECLDTYTKKPDRGSPWLLATGSRATNYRTVTPLYLERETAKNGLVSLLLT